ncbi:hypothetical protein [Prescottella subtropica]|uniref:hypothetical protein n=1 Tax=Prescottella subtropica TaxID=2545757 RepID=UPI0010F86EC0|nr:hypothetical protein [Prescottella subtropica]
MSDDDTGSGSPSRRIAAWSFGLSVVSVVAAGVVVAGLLHTPEPELTTAPPTTTTPPPSPERPEYSYVTPSVTYPTQITGCDVVEPPSKGEFVAYLRDKSPGYDNPTYPWFSGPKALAMSEALVGALPAGTEVEFASPEASLYFRPIVSDEESAPDLGGSTDTSGTLLRGDARGSLWVSVQQNADPVPPCVAGALDARRTLGDGTVVDVQDTWSETDGERTLSRSATAYTTDGSRIHLSASDSSYSGGEEKLSGTVPLSIDELVTLATLPALRVTAPVPPGTGMPPTSCAASVEGGPAIDRTTAARVGAALAVVPLPGVTTDRPLGALWPAGYDAGTLCQAVQVTTPGSESELRVAISGGQDLPNTSETSSGRGSYDGTVTEFRTLADGSIVERREHHYAQVGMEAGAQSTQMTSRTVAVTRPSGGYVQAVSNAAVPVPPLSFEQLEAIVLAPGLEVTS